MSPDPLTLKICEQLILARHAKLLRESVRADHHSKQHYFADLASETKLCADAIKGLQEAPRGARAHPDPRLPGLRAALEIVMKLYSKGYPFPIEALISRLEDEIRELEATK